MRRLASCPPLLLAAFVAFVIANLIHNRFGLDAAVLPAALALGLAIRWPRRGFQVATAALIALPSFAFLDWAALAVPGQAERFFNHLSLLAAGGFALAAGVLALLPRRTPGLEPAR